MLRHIVRPEVAYSERISMPAYRLAAWLTGATVSFGASQTSELRNALPEPWDFADHSANVAYTFSASMAAALVTTALAAKKYGRELSPTVARGACLAGALAAGAIVNALGETSAISTYLENAPGQGRSEWVDAAYGMATAGAIGLTLIRANIPQK